jgi:DNA-binding transcriptional MocR family regulator
MVQRTGPTRRLYSGPMTGADFLQLSPASAPSRGLTSWLAGAIRAAIIDGRLPAGTSLPATRLLAGDLGISRGVVVGELERHIRGVRQRQRSRRDALLGALRVLLPEARVQGVPAGLHLLITFPAPDGQVDDRELAERIHRAGVLVHPLSWHRQLPGPPGLVLGYAAHTPDQLREAARRIARVLL